MSLLKVALLAGLFICLCVSASAQKKKSIFLNQDLRQRADANIKRFQWAADVKRNVVEAARPWREMSDEQLWEMMFGPNITRSWMVWSNGHCPACEEAVPMYNWEMDPIARPWKVWCPHCEEAFPKNDFGKFRQSGLDGSGIFDPARADRSLLFNEEHPDPNDPLHKFGVDDGEGYVQGEDRWRFIGAYLIYGQWKKGVLAGITALAAAYSLTGEAVYAHKAGVLLDRVADLYPSFDFKTQAVIYERKLGSNGYVSVWHDACEETRELALGYDQVFDGMKGDPELVAFLAKKAAQVGLENSKDSFAKVQANIEERILRDALTNAHKIASNYPRTPIAIAIMKAVLGWPGDREEVMKVIDGFVTQATAVDGVTGEKGLANYSAFGLQSLAIFLARWDQAIPGFLEDMLKRHPKLHDTYRFHIDTWCMTEYYPLSGDSGWFAGRIDQYQGVRFRSYDEAMAYSHKDAVMTPSMYTFMWRLAQLTDDPAFVQVMHIANGNTTDGMPHDLFAEDPTAFQAAVGEVIAREGGAPKPGNVNKQQWHLGILRGGDGEHRRAVWLDYDAGGGHSHMDGMNLGLFAHGLDLMPDFGYPPVQFGGWGSPQAVSYKHTESHNTVAVDVQGQANAVGRTTLWADGEHVNCIRASGPAMVGGQQYERTAVMVDVSAESFYILDIFRVVGGTDHARFFHSHFGSVSTEGLKLVPGEPYNARVQMRDYRTDPSPEAGWAVTWDVDDRYGRLPDGKRVHLRYTDLTPGASATLGEGWVVAGGYSSTEEAWIPRVITRRQSETAPLASTFVAVIEPYSGGAPAIKSVRRVAVTETGGAAYGDGHVAVEVELADGRRDLIAAMDVENPLGIEPAFAAGKTVRQAQWDLETDAELSVFRMGVDGKARWAAVCKGSHARIGAVAIPLDAGTQFVERDL